MFAVGLLVAPAVHAAAPTAAPGNVMVTATDSEITVSWDVVADADNGGSAIIDYTATASEGANTFTCSGTADTCLITGLDNGTEYSVTVVATNSEGDGPPSVAVTATPIAVPTAAPTNVMLIPADSQIIVSWDAVVDADNSGGAITSYTATTIEGANTFTCSAGTTTNVCQLTGLDNGTEYSVTVVAGNSGGNGPPSVAVPATPRVALANTLPVAQIVPADFDLEPGADFTPGGSFRLLFVTTDTTTSLSSDLSLYNAFVQTSANDGHNDIRRFSSEFRALISTEAVDARNNTVTNSATGTDTDAPIYWLNGNKVADDYANFYDGEWDSQVGRDRNGETTNPLSIWTGSENDGTEAFLPDGSSLAIGEGVGIGSQYGKLVPREEIAGSFNGIRGISSRNQYPLYALSPILTLNQAPTVSTPILNQIAFADAAFTYTFSAFTDADNDTITYSASESPDATWLNFDAATRTFSGTPAMANDGEVITITVTASDDMDSVTDVFTVTVRDDTTRPVFTSGASVAVTIKVGLSTSIGVFDADATDSNGVTYSLDEVNDYALFNIDPGTGVVNYKEVPMTSGITQTLTIIATDAAGNSAEQELVITLAGAPILTITTGPINIVGEYANNTFLATFTWSEAVSGFEEDDITTGFGEPNIFTPVTAGLIYTLSITPPSDSDVSNDGVVDIVVSEGSVSSVANGDTNALTVVRQKSDIDAPIFTVGATDMVTFVLNDPSLEVYDAAATDGGGTADDGITYSLAEVGHYALFNIDPGSGVVTYNAPPTDGDSHSIRIVATDKGGNTDDDGNPIALALSISVINRATVESVSATDGFYKEDDSVPITVTFSEAVTVTGTPRLVVDSSTTRSGGLANYASGSGLTLTFTYIVRGGDDTRDLDYAGTDALRLNGGTIQNAAAVDAYLILPTVGSLKSLFGTSDVVLDTTAPVFPDTSTILNRHPVTIATGSTTTTEVYDANARDAGRTADMGITYELITNGGGLFELNTIGELTLLADNPDFGTYDVTITATDEAGNVGTQYLRVEVLPATPTFRTTILDQSYPAEMTIETLTLPPAIGGTGALSYTLMPDASSLELVFNSADRTLSGMPTTPTEATALTYTVSDGADPPNTAALTFIVTIATALPPPPISQTVSANYTFAPSPVPADRKFRLLFVTTQTTAARSADIDTYNAFVQTSAAVGHSDIRGFNSEFRALISTDTVDARVNTATNRVSGSDTEAPIYWLGGVKVADDYADFYDDDGWDSPAGRDRNGDTYTFTAPTRDSIWTGSMKDGTVHKSDQGNRGAGSVLTSGSNIDTALTVFGELERGKEIFSNAITTHNNERPLYALSPVLTLNHAPTISTTDISDQTAPIGAAFTKGIGYPFPDFTDADSGDTLTYSAEIPDAAWLTFNPATLIFSGTPTADDAGVLTITVTASDDIDEVTAEFTVTVAGLMLTPTSLMLDEGTTTTYTAILTREPTDTVTVTITGDNPDVTTAPATLTFTTTTWDEAQTVTLTAAEDADAVQDDAVLAHAFTSNDPNYDDGVTNLSVTVMDNDTITTLTTRLNEQILSRAVSAMTAGTLAAVAARVEAAADGSGGSGKPLAFELDGRSSLRRLLEKNGKAMLEETMDYQRLLDGASFVLPLSATDNASTGNTGKTAVWGSSGFHNLAADEDDLEWDGKTLSVHLGLDKRLSEQALAGLALSWNDAGFDYHDTADGADSEGEYQYSVVTIHPYFGWSNDGLKLWGTVGFGQGEITIDQELSTETMSTDTTQLSLAGGFSHRLSGSAGSADRSVHLKGDVALTSVAVAAVAGKFAEQDVGSQRVRLLLSGAQSRELSSGGGVTPSLEVGVRFDGGDGATGAGVELGGGLRYANPGGDLSVSGNVRTLLAGGYDEFGVDVTVQLVSQSGRGLSFSVRPVWGRAESAAERLWDEGVSELTGGDTALQGSVDTEVGYGLSATMLGSPGLLTPYTGMTARDGGSSRLRLGGRFTGGNGLSLNLEGAQKNTADGASHQVLLRGEVGF